MDRRLLPNWQSDARRSDRVDLVCPSDQRNPGARGNEGAARRRAFSLRLVGDDARYVERPGPTSPPFPGHGMVAGQRLREDWFPVLRA